MLIYRGMGSVADILSEPLSPSTPYSRFDFAGALLNDGWVSSSSTYISASINPDDPSLNQEAHQFQPPPINHGFTPSQILESFVDHWETLGHDASIPTEAEYPQTATGSVYSPEQYIMVSSLGIVRLS